MPSTAAQFRVRASRCLRRARLTKSGSSAPSCLHRKRPALRPLRAGGRAAIFLVPRAGLALRFFDVARHHSSGAFSGLRRADQAAHPAPVLLNLRPERRALGFRMPSAGLRRHGVQQVSTKVIRWGHRVAASAIVQCCWRSRTVAVDRPRRLRNSTKSTASIRTRRWSDDAGMVSDRIGGFEIRVRRSRVAPIRTWMCGERRLWRSERDRRRSFVASAAAALRVDVRRPAANAQRR